MAWPVVAAIAAQTAMNWYQGRVQDRKTAQANEANRQMQIDFARNGIKWRVQDAREAGVHPLFALGANVPSASPSYEAGDSGYLGRMGQNVTDAVRAVQTEEERRMELMNLQMMQGKLQEQDLRNEALTVEIARARQKLALTSPFPGGAGQVTVVPDQKISEHLKDSSITAGERHPAWKQYEIFPGVTWDILYSQEGPAEGMEGMGPMGAMMFRNLIYRPTKYLRDMTKSQREAVRTMLIKHKLNQMSYPSH